MQDTSFAWLRPWVRVCVLLACVAVFALPASASGFLQGKGQWDPELVRQYFKYFRHLDISPGPGDYPNRQMLTGITQNCHYDDGSKVTVTSQVNAEFAKRVDVLMAVYRAAGGKFNARGGSNFNVGIVRCSGALRSKEYQLHLYAEGRHDPAGPNGTTPVGQWVQDNPHAKCPAGAMVTCQSVGWHNVGLAVDLGQFKDSGKYDNGSGFMSDLAFELEVYPAMDALGMLSGASFGDPAHVEWHPNLSTITAAGSLGTAANVNAGYAWKFPSTIFSWSPYQQELDVYDFGNDGNWITVKDTRMIKMYANSDDWSGDWITYSPAVKVFPAYTPTVDLSNFERLYGGTSSVEVKSYEVAGKKEIWIDTKGSLISLPNYNIKDLQKEANVMISKARSLGVGSAAYKAAIKPYLKVNDHSFYDVTFGTSPAGSPSIETVKRRSDYHEGFPPDELTRQTNGQVGGVSLQIAWNRDSGDVGFNIEDLERQPYQVRDLKHTTLGGQVIGPTLPPGAIDKTGPPNWPF